MKKFVVMIALGIMLMLPSVSFGGWRYGGIERGPFYYYTPRVIYYQPVYCAYTPVVYTYSPVVYVQPVYVVPVYYVPIRCEPRRIEIRYIYRR